MALLLNLLLLALCWQVCAQETNRPMVRMLVPGFTVRELPLQLPNINNLLFAPDGRLFALGYDGRIWVLRDLNADGLEEKAEVFWDKPTLSVPVGMTWSPNGLIVSSHGKVSLFKESPAGVAEEVIASGWPATDVGSGGVDATGVTVDKNGNVYFGLICANYANAYRLTDGKPHYDLKSPRGTVQKWSPATKKLETIATGIRVPYKLLFNRLGDLFLTDQEGETWMPRGNPLDELNHIIAGKNYGFPPPHPRYLPGLISEPPVVAFGPQHQSACGFVFNERNEQHAAFGPSWWEGDALVAGESRGKIWRVRLTKAGDRYVGQSYPIASLAMLTMDLALSRRGDLYVTCHSGEPDWGTGPNGPGKIFKISYTDRKQPQPVAIWAQSLAEIRIAFDRPISSSITNGLQGATILCGENVRAADRLEVLKPPYEAVRQQLGQPVGHVKILGARLLEDQRTLALSTAPHPQSVHYALSLRSGTNDPIDLEYTLHGVQGDWSAWGGRGKPGWNGWFPHLDSAVNSSITGESGQHQRLLHLMSTRGRLALKTRLDLPAGSNTVRIVRYSPFTAALGGQTLRATLAGRRQFVVEFRFQSGEEPVPLEVDFDTGSSTRPQCRVTWWSKTDPTERPLPLDRLLMPFAPPSSGPPPVIPPDPTLTLEGNWVRGKELFSSERLKCSTCHRIGEQGAQIGPDLSNLRSRDSASVLRDVLDPNLTINPDYVTFSANMKDGTEFGGFVRAQRETEIVLVDQAGQEKKLPRAALRELKPSRVSLMPVGLIDSLTRGERADLLVFLTQRKPEWTSGETFPTRRRKEVESILARAARSAGSSLSAFRITLVASKQDHGPGEHDYPSWQAKWQRLLAAAEKVEVQNAWEWPSEEQFRTADVLVFYCWNHDWSSARLEQIQKYQARGGGIVLIHSACIADKDPEVVARPFGLSAQPVRTKYRHGPFDLKFPDPANPILRGLPAFVHFLDEPYWPMIGQTERVAVLGTSSEEGEDRPLLWTFQSENGRVFGTILGHFQWTLDDPYFRIIALRGIAWAGKQPIERLVRLAEKEINPFAPEP